MVTIVLTNLSLIIFDLTYFKFRPFYFENFPKILQFYDKPILGIEPHRLTESYIEKKNFLKYLVFLDNPDSINAEVAKKYPDAIALVTKHYESVKEIEEYLNLAKLQNRNLSLYELQNLKIQVEDQPITEFQIDVVESLDKVILLQKIGSTYERNLLIAETISKMDSIMIKIVERNPFQESGQVDLFKAMQKIIKDYYAKFKTRSLDKEIRFAIARENKSTDSVPSTAVAFHFFWENPKISYPEKFAFFESEIQHKLELNFYRNIDKNGKPVYNYIYLDAPFLVFFLLEFIISWYISIRKKEYIAWFLYPIYHWYDILGFLPIVEFRLFRLVRLYKMYLILSTNQYTKIIGNDLVSRSIKYYANIIKEELSDMVTLQILTEMQNETRSGESLATITNAIFTHKEDIKRVTIQKMRNLVENPKFDELLKNLIQEITSRSLQSNALTGLIPDSIRNTIVDSTSQAFFQAIKSGIHETILDTGNTKSMETLLDYAITELAESSKDEMINDLNTKITVEYLENVKRNVSKKNWLRTKI